MSSLHLKIPPVFVVLATGAAMWLICRASPGLRGDLPARAAIAGTLFTLGAAVVVLGVVRFRHARTTIDPMHPDKASALVITGVFRVTRNPMYLGLLLFLIGWAILLAHPVAALVVPAFVAYIDRFQIRPEEAALTDRFGARYKEYARTVRRWL